MEINYKSSSYALLPFYQFEVAGRHLCTALSRIKTLPALQQAGVIEQPGGKSYSLLSRAKHLILGIVELLPIIGLMIAVTDRFFYGYTFLPTTLNPKFIAAIQKTPSFKGYALGRLPELHITDLSVRPSNLFYKALFNREDPTTQPGETLFEFTRLQSEIRKEILSKKDGQEISFSPKDVEHAYSYQKKWQMLNKYGPRPLSDFLGSNTYRISGKEVKEMVKNQKIFLSSLLPRKFYTKFKEALTYDKTVLLPNLTVADLMGGKANAQHGTLSQLFASVAQYPHWYGFNEKEGVLTFEEFKKLSLYQIGAMVVKTDHYRCLVNDDYELAERKVGEKDDILLVNLCGIRPSYNQGAQFLDKKIMTETFKTTFKSIDKGGIAVIPAIGMGVWGGVPETYWTALLEAIVHSGDPIEHFFINPGHQKTQKGSYKGYSGSEFASILASFKKKYPQNQNLKRITNLFDRKTDLLLLAKNLKKSAPEKTIALFNASDPDVTLGNHVGEYVNNFCHPSTTEENYTACGTNGINFEGVTAIQQHPSQIIGY